MPRCPACRRSPELRAGWGCDSDAPRDLFRVTCSDCSGGDTECPRCAGTGTYGVRRCPASHCDAPIAAAFDSYLRIEHGILPVDGGWSAQSASFCAFVRIMDGERGRIDKERRDDQERANRAATANMRR